MVISSLLFVFSSFASYLPVKFYFLDESDKNETLVYSAFCWYTDKQPLCEIRRMAIRNSSVSRVVKCSVASYDLVTTSTATKSGDAFIISKEDEFSCGNSTTYLISKAGMVRTTTPPSIKKQSYCDEFEPRVEKYKAVAKPTDLKINIEGCKTLSVEEI